MERIGPYRVLEFVARGGMGVVYRARDEALGRDVAIKTLRVNDPLQRERFLRECHALAQIRHPHVMPCYAAGEHQGEPYLVLPFMAAESLADRLARGPLPLKRVAEIGAQLARALAFLHERGILHRDLKPENVLFSEHDTPLLGDFGLVKFEAQVEDLTQTGAMIGTPEFWPPEQAHGRRDQIGPASDVYGLAATLYCAVTGEPPHAAESLAALISQLEREPAPPSRLRAEIPPALDRLLLDCLRRNPAERPDALELAESLEEFATTGSLSRTGGSGGRRGLALAAVLAVLGVLGTTALWIARAPTPAPAPEARVPHPRKPNRPAPWATELAARNWHILEARARRGEYSVDQLTALRREVIEGALQSQPFELETLREVVRLLKVLHEGGAPAYPWRPLPFAPWSPLTLFDPARTAPRNPSSAAARDRYQAEVFSAAVIGDVAGRGPYLKPQPPMFPFSLPHSTVELTEGLVEAGLPLGDRWVAELCMDLFGQRASTFAGVDRWRFVRALTRLGAHLQREFFPAPEPPPTAWADGDASERALAAMWRFDEQAATRVALEQDAPPAVRALAASWVLSRGAQGPPAHALIAALELDSLEPFAAIRLAKAKHERDAEDPQVEALYRRAAFQAQNLHVFSVHLTSKKIEGGVLFWPRVELWKSAALLALRQGHPEESTALLRLLKRKNLLAYFDGALEVAVAARNVEQLRTLVAEAERTVRETQDRVEAASTPQDEFKRGQELKVYSRFLAKAKEALAGFWE